ncbi:hypothetical protein [Candidatus Poriferisodalis sp.]
MTNGTIQRVELSYWRAVRRIEARKARKQARDAHRAEQWRGTV